ncbi:hypothetical protein [Echinicola salinicaeni]|uniref:hypothetical protein n=1 Tax=Echinicola salinicaeni TaxID=2762757 RepID=UPI0016485C07|nr:hypothetical protein [Echinicola salinicaeni]
MDSQKHPIDELFSQKLKQHQERPSNLSWERLDAQLGHQKKSNKPAWIKVAAVIIGIFALTILLWRIDFTENKENYPMLAEQTPALNQESLTQSAVVPTDSSRQSVEKIEKPIDANNDTEKVEDEKDHKPVIKSKPAPTKENLQKELLPDNSLVAAASNRKTIEKAPEIKPERDLGLPELENKKISIDELIADNGTVDKKEEPVAYTVKIKSSGISEKPQKENLVSEIGEKINTLGGLIGKVDKGYADLQDAKNNLFASLISKKEDN